MYTDVGESSIISFLCKITFTLIDFNWFDTVTKYIGFVRKVVDSIKKK